jgi:hypothetical protein
MTGAEGKDLVQPVTAVAAEHVDRRPLASASPARDGWTLALTGLIGGKLSATRPCPTVHSYVARPASPFAGFIENVGPGAAPPTKRVPARAAARAPRQPRLAERPGASRPMARGVSQCGR